MILLQRGRALSSAELWRCDNRFNHGRLASTGPRSFERGIEFGNVIERSHYRRFNGAALFRARNSGRFPLHALERPSFNGAALFRARNCVFRTKYPRFPARFNGAALFRARNSRGTQPAKQPPAASTGPRSFERGIISIIFSPLGHKMASTGPRSFERGIRHNIPIARATQLCFNGAALFRARN